MPKPTSVTLSENYELKAKSLKKGDPIWVGKRVLTVKSNDKNDDNGKQRVIQLKWGSGREEDEVTLIVPAKAMFRVTRRRHIHTKF